jgi:hypothetical protein
MINFINLPAVQILDSGFYKLTQNFKVIITFRGKDYLVLVPRGMKTDFTSVPRIFWSFFSKDDPEYLKSALFHDFLYWRGGLIQAINIKTNEKVSLKITRKEADCYFRDGAEVLGSGLIKRNILYSSVRLGGSSSWKGKEKKRLKVEKHKSIRVSPDPRIRG